MVLSLLDIALLILIGLAGGALGGMLGIGGSVVIVPALVLLTTGRDWHSQHLFQAAAMIVNVFVAVPAALKHRSKGAIRGDLFRIMLPTCLIAIIIGVTISNWIDSDSLKRLFGAFLILIIFSELSRFVRRRPEPPDSTALITLPRAGSVGTIMGFFAGLLGIGGGMIAVPIAQRLCKIPLRQAIGAAAAVMGFTAIVGATYKVSTLPEHGARPLDAAFLALLLGIGAVVGSYLGAGLTHRAPVNTIRVVFLIVLTLGALRMITG